MVEVVEVLCIVCGKTFKKYARAKKSQRCAKDIKPANFVTCSRTCSKIRQATRTHHLT